MPTITLKHPAALDVSAVRPDCLAGVAKLFGMWRQAIHRINNGARGPADLAAERRLFDLIVSSGATFQPAVLAIVEVVRKGTVPSRPLAADPASPVLN